jgi:hypothetical protein
MHATTNKGLHEFVAEHVLARYARHGIRAADLSSGPGVMAARLHSFGCDVLAVDRTAEGFEAGLPHVALDFGQNDFASKLGPASFDLSQLSRSSNSRAPSVSSATSAVCSLLGELR